MTELCDIGVIGLAVMGANLARNAARKGFGVALYNRHGARTDAADGGARVRGPLRRLPRPQGLRGLAVASRAP